MPTREELQEAAWDRRSGDRRRDLFASRFKSGLRRLQEAPPSEERPPPREIYQNLIPEGPPGYDREGNLSSPVWNAPSPMPIPATPAPLEPPPPLPMVPATPPTATGPGMNVKGGAATPAVPQTTPGMNLKGGPQTPQTPPMGTVWQPPSQPTPVDPRAEQIGKLWPQPAPQTPPMTPIPPPPDYSEWDNYLTGNYARGGLTRYRRY